MIGPDVVLSFTLPALTTTSGALLISWVVLNSPLFVRLETRARNRVFLVFAILYLVAICIPAKIAGDRLWAHSSDALKKQLNKR